MNAAAQINEEGSCPLGARDLEFIKWASLGKTAFETAVIMGVSEPSVRTATYRAGERVGAHNKTALVALAIRKGWIE